ncbi:hypothetical protein BV210_06720 [Halorientalis sp. IM1011]|uniref:DUF7519 family protein n=1 Tax=Halorientalis sp. IM1011 TaxID=1932360 RepID=UPI00097CD0D7|nr:hypothetical protein [Halorientalis sp. IM1011]AQL42424.1 hypothetical protein BV210_06720 [Halorientalis sp. IM1011]
MTDDGATDGGSHARDEPVVPRLGSGDGVVATLVETAADVQLSALSGGLVALVAASLVGWQLLGVRLTLVSSVSGVLLAAGLYALRSDRVAVLFAAGALLTPASIGLAIALGVGVAFGLDVGQATGHLASVTVCLLVGSGFGAVLTAVPLDEGEVLAGSFMRFVGMLVPLTVAQAIVVAIAAWDSLVVSLARLVVDSPDPLLALGRSLLAPTGSAALLSFLLYVLLLLFLFRLVLRAIPLVKLFPPRQRPMVTARLDRLVGRLGRVLFLAVGGAIVLFIAALVAGLSTPAALSARFGVVAAPVVWVLTTLWVRILFVLAIGTMAAILASERLRRRVRRLSEADLLRQGTPPLGAFATALLFGVIADLLIGSDELLARVPATVRPTVESLLGGGVVTAVLVVAFGALILAGIAFVSLSVLVSSPILPEQALGPTLASAAVFALALLLVLFGGSSLVAFLAVAAALVVWDTGEYATGLREELPDGAVTTRAELVHVGASLAVGLLAVVGAVLLALLIASDLLVPSVPDTTLAAGAVVLAFGTTMVLLSSLRE